MSVRVARPALLALALALALGGSLLTAGPAPGTAAGAAGQHGAQLDGHVTFMRQDDDGFWQTWVASADLRTQRRITDGDANSGWPVLSPRAPVVAFDSDRTDPDPADDLGVNDVFVIRPDGTGLRQVTDSVGVSSDPGWSPDGRSLAIAADRGDYPAAQGIYVVGLDGAGLRRVTVLPDGAGLDTAPRFSPDGGRLVFTRYAWQDGRELGALFTVDLDGHHEHQVTPYAVNAGDATWSPDGRTLAFEAYPRAESRGDIFTVRADGRHLVNLTRNDADLAGSADPVWSPRGRRIMFLDASRTDANAELDEGLAVMTARGRHRRFVADPGAEHQPDWQVYHHSSLGRRG